MEKMNPPLKKKEKKKKHRRHFLTSVFNIVAYKLVQRHVVRSLAANHIHMLAYTQPRIVLLQIFKRGSVVFFSRVSPLLLLFFI